MKALKSILILFIIGVSSLTAQDVTTVQATSTDISDNLDLEAVASVFAEAKDLEDFEKRLNDPETRISNLDLNEDGYVDYLRVVEKAEGDAHAITIQAVIGKDLYQDVATIDVEKDEKGETRVQVVGDVYMYGPQYIIEPVYMYHPPIFLWIWGPRYSVWYSPYCWDYYPSYFSYWAPYTTVVYVQYIPLHVHRSHVYHRVYERQSAVCVTLEKEVSRSDLAKDKPEQTFVSRNEGIKNRTELEKRRVETGSELRPNRRTDVEPNSREVDKEWRPQSEKEGRESQVKEGKVVVPQKTEQKRPDSSTQPDRKESDQSKKPTNERVIKDGPVKKDVPRKEPATSPKLPSRNKILKPSPSSKEKSKDRSKK